MRYNREVEQIPRRIVIGLIICLLFFLAGCEREVKFGVLDIQEVIERAPLAREFQERLDETGKEIEERFKEDSTDVSEEERMAKQQKAYQEYIILKQELEEELNTHIEEAVREVAKEERLTLIFYRQAVRYGGYDITELVIAKLGGEES